MCSIPVFLPQAQRPGARHIKRDDKARIFIVWRKFIAVSFLASGMSYIYFNILLQTIKS